jgi:hypothetical protein
MNKKQRAEQRAQIARWMRDHVADHVDGVTDEVNCTTLVEEWDCECADGGATLDPDHVAWEVAVEVAEAHAAPCAA